MEEAGNHVACEDGIALQVDYPSLIAGTSDFSPQPTEATIEKQHKPNNVQIAFEIKKLDAFVAKMKAAEGIGIFHDITQYLWGQRVFRFYDFDGHLIELDEADHLWAI